MGVRVPAAELPLKEGLQSIVIYAARSRQPMGKLPGGNMRRLFNRLFLKARFKICLFARVGDDRPCLRLHYFCLA